MSVKTQGGNSGQSSMHQESMMMDGDKMQQDQLRYSLREDSGLAPSELKSYRRVLSSGVI